MNELLDPGKLTLFAFFVVPGFVAMKVYDLFVPTERRNFSDSVIEVISYSCMNFVVAFVPLKRAYEAELLTTRPFFAALVLIGTLVLLPALLAIGWLRLQRAPALRGRLIHPTPTGWDYFFGTGQTCWVIFHLKGGMRIGAYYGNDSYASSYPHPEQVYVQQLWRLDDNGVFVAPADRSLGAIISRDDCDLVELFTTED